VRKKTVDELCKEPGCLVRQWDEALPAGRDALFVS